METLTFIIILIATFIFMEFMAWFTHKFVMHGFLWMLHKDHHQKEPGFFEKNDSFFLIFAIPSMACLYFGFTFSNSILTAIGLGILLYGMAYFLVHDIFIHQRFKLFRKTDNKYLRGIRRAHRAHHRHIGKEDGESFGMLLAHKRYFKELFRA